MLNWLDDHTFLIDGEKITLDYALGGSKRQSGSSDFTMMKTPSFLEHYLALQGHGIRKVLELGVYQGGSFVFLDKLLRPDRISAVELSTAPIPALDNYVRKNSDRARMHYGTSQDDVAALERIVAEDFGGSIDLVVDDASHWYEPTKTAFKTLFPKLRPGGTYIIEDCFWSFEAAFQSPDHPWSPQPSLSNILIDLAEELTINNAVQRVMIERELMIITKTNDAAHGPMMQDRGLRGRERVLI